VTYFLVHYNRRTEDGRILATFEDSDATSANAAVREAESAKEDFEEVVLLSARDLDTLKRTHGRYFYKATELARL